MSTQVIIKDHNAWGKNMIKQIWSTNQNCPKNNTDILFKCQDGDIACHQGLLKTTCLTIDKVLQSLPTDIQFIDEQITFIVPDFNIRTVQQFLEMIYTGSSGLEKLDDLENIIQFATKHLGFFIAVNFNVFIEKVTTSVRPTALVGNLVIDLEPESLIQMRLAETSLNADYEDPVIDFNDSGLGASMNDSEFRHSRSLECELIDLDSLELNQNFSTAHYGISDHVEPKSVEIIDLEQSASLDISVLTQTEITQILEVIEIDENNSAHCQDLMNQGNLDQNPAGNDVIEIDSINSGQPNDGHCQALMDQDNFTQNSTKNEIDETEATTLTMNNKKRSLEPDQECNFNKRKLINSTAVFAPAIMTTLYMNNIAEAFKDFDEKFEKIKKEKRERKLLNQLLVNGRIGLIEGTRSSRSRFSNHSSESSSNNENKRRRF